MLLLMPGFRLRHSDDKVRKLFEGRGVSVDIVFTKTGNRIVRSLVVASSSDKPWLVCIHGAPGSGMDFFQYLTDRHLLNRYNMISVDRPGYGYSGFGQAIPSIDEQAGIICSVMRSQSIGQGITLLAHSYGGPIAARIAMDQSMAVSSLWMLAPAVDPENEKEFKIARFAHRKPLAAFVPEVLKVAASEKLVHAQELTKIHAKWPAITAQVVHIHGTKDSIVPYINLRFSSRILRNARFRGITLHGANHFFVWTHSAKIIELLSNDDVM
jgi:pimeloyl-ACP methyl ester carboxylesterase